MCVPVCVGVIAKREQGRTQIFRFGADSLRKLVLLYLRSNEQIVNVWGMCPAGNLTIENLCYDYWARGLALHVL